MDLARAPRRTARKKGSGYENAAGHTTRNEYARSQVKIWNLSIFERPAEEVGNIYERIFFVEFVNNIIDASRICLSATDDTTV
jgi:hypothetical protein